MKKKSNILLFLVGLFSQTQIHVFGSIGISELVLFVVAPVVFLQDYAKLRRDGVNTILLLSILACFGCWIASTLGRIHPANMLKGIASPYSLFAGIVCFHRLLATNLSGLKWMILGATLSLVLNVFVFRPETHTVRNGELLVGTAAFEAMTGYVLFWTNRISAFLRLPIMGWYQRVPRWYCFTVPLVLVGIFLRFSGGSGRSAGLMILCSWMLLVIGGKRQDRMYAVRKKVLFILIGLACLGVIFKCVYQYTASQGLLGEEAATKYERIAKDGKVSMLRMLISGRLHTFTGVRACLDKPLLGFGAKAPDTNGYYQEMLEKYGNMEDYENYVNGINQMIANGSYYTMAIPAHSHIVAAWIDSGIFGLILWLYVLFLVFRFFLKDTAVVPAWYGYFCMTLPPSIWDIFFSPFGGRVSIALMITALLLVRAAHQGRLFVPYELIYLKQGRR